MEQDRPHGGLEIVNKNITEAPEELRRLREATQPTPQHRRIQE